MKKTILKFSANWCQPCKRMLPIMEELKQLRPNVTIEDIDIDVSPLLASKYKVKMLPTIIILDEELEIARFNGVTTLATIIEKL